jgi:hypothetical protein
MDTPALESGDQTALVSLRTQRGDRNRLFDQRLLRRLLRLHARPRIRRAGAGDAKRASA